MTTVIRVGSPDARAAQAAGRYVYIGRPSKWGNPFRIGRDGTRDQVVERFAQWWGEDAQAPLRQAAILELTDKSLGCYCKPARCHGDVIAAFLNARH